MGNITNFFAPVSKSASKDQSEKKTEKKKRKAGPIIESDEDDDFQPVEPPAKKRAVPEVRPSEYFGSKKKKAEPVAEKPKAAPVKKEAKKATSAMDIDEPPAAAQPKPKPKATSSSSRKRAIKIDSDDDEADFVPKKEEPKEKEPVPAPAPEPPAKKLSGKAAFFAMKNRTGPQALGSRPRPEGEPGCLNGLAFVITGEYETLTRSDVEELVKTYGGRMTGAVSGKTNYLLFGRGAGETKKAKAKKLGVKVLDEDAFYELINTSKGQETVMEMPPEPAPSKSKSTKGKAAASSAPTVAAPSHEAGDMLWTEKYKPTSSANIIGNKKLIESIKSWLGHWEENRKSNFEGHGDNSMEGFRAILISGPPGVGKTTTAQLVAKENGYEPLEFNASDVRNRKVLQEMLSDTTDNRSMTEFFSGGKKPVQKKSKQGRVVLIMDEVDGMTAGDRGGSVELAKMIKTTKIPVICICNDSRSDKVKPLLKVAFECKFIRTPAKNMRAALMKICFNEKLKVEPNALDELVAITGNDIRQVINILSSYRLAHTDMKYNDAKTFGGANQKYSQINLFEIPGKLLSVHAWARPRMNELSEVYFHDYSLSHLMMFENYTKWSPNKAEKWCESGNPNEVAVLEMDLIAKAANAMADGDLVDTRITLKQDYSLMPVHSIFSCVKPAYYMTGNTKGMARVGFPMFLGQLSKTNKHKRQLANIQTKLRTRGGADVIRQNYVPALTSQIFADIAKGDYDKAMDIMDYYYLDKENLEALNDVSLDDKPPMNLIPAANKRKFNAAYKKRSHPVLFELSDTTPLKSKAKVAVDMQEDREGAIFEVEEDEAALASDDE